VPEGACNVERQMPDVKNKTMTIRGGFAALKRLTKMLR